MIQIFGFKLVIEINEFQLRIMETFKSEIDKLIFIFNIDTIDNKYKSIYSELINYIILLKPYLLYKLIKTKNWTVRFEIATKLENIKHKWLKLKLINKLSIDSKNLVRAMISILPSTPLKIVKRLIKDEDKVVSEEAKTNDKLMEIYFTLKEDNYK